MAEVLFNPFAPGFLEDPYPHYARLRREAPVYRHPGGFYAVSRHADALRVLTRPEVHSSMAMGGPVAPEGAAAELAPTAGSLIGQDPPAHTRQRNVVSRAFTPRRIAALEPRIRALADALVDEVEGKGECDLMDALANPLPVVVIAELLGMDPGRREDFKRWSTALIVNSTSGVSPRERAADAALIRAFRREMEAVVAARRRAPGDDLISVLLHGGEDEEILTSSQVVAFAALLLAAGSETTTNLIGNALLALFAHREWLDAVREDPGRLPRVLEETLRFESPVQMVMRFSLAADELEGGRIERGSFVAVLLGAANRDEARFPRAARFDPERDLRGHLAFGFGNHFCLGASLARLEARIALETLLARLPDLRPGSAPPERHASLLVRGPRTLPVRFSA